MTTRSKVGIKLTAADTIGLMSALKIDKAHIIGASMGGMIGQIIAAKYPERVLSLGVLFSSNNQPMLPPPHPKAFFPLIKGPGAKAPRDVLLNHSVKLFIHKCTAQLKISPQKLFFECF